MSDTEKLARDSIDAFNRADWDAVRAMCAPGVVYDETGTGRHLEGIDAFVGLSEGWRSAIPDLTGEILRVVSDADTAALEVRWTGTQTGPLPTPTGDIPPTGRQAVVMASMWITVADGRITSETNHLDVLGMLSQLGVLNG